MNKVKYGLVNLLINKITISNLSNIFKTLDFYVEYNPYFTFDEILLVLVTKLCHNDFLYENKSNTEWDWLLIFAEKKYTIRDINDCQKFLNKFYNYIN